MEKILKRYIGKKVEISAQGEYGTFSLVGEMGLDEVDEYGVFVSDKNSKNFIAWSEIKYLSVQRQPHLIGRKIGKPPDPQ